MLEGVTLEVDVKGIVLVNDPDTTDVMEELGDRHLRYSFSSSTATLYPYWDL